VRRRFLVAAGTLVLAALAVVHLYLPGHVERGLNVTLHPPPYTASAAAKELHRTLLVADLHADTLMWDRDLLQRGRWGHVDVPRLIEGNVAVQAFTVVTKSPRKLNIEANRADSDDITLLAIAQRWPVASWSNLTERALYQARRLERAAQASNGRLTLLRTRQDVRDYLNRRRKEPGIVAGFLGIEGAHALSGDVSNLDRLHGAGFRMIGLAHFFDNEMAGSAHGIEKGGLTGAGRELVRRMEARSTFVDLAHASPRVVDEVLAMATRPVIVSHTGVRGTCDNRRNLSDAQLAKIAANGGVVGIGFWETATCGEDAAAVARAVRYAVDRMGIDHVALGSDFDGAIAAPFDASGLVQVTDALLKAGFTTDQIRAVMGENVLRLLQSHLP
jgi:microsomal dipeptidase-like Zn-dependent dipeptidase